MKKFMMILVAFLMISTVIVAQEVMDEAAKIAEYKAEIAAKSATVAAKQAEIDALTGEIAGLEKQINLAAGWRFSSGGVLGFTLGGFENWFRQANPNSQVSNITGNFGGTATLDRDKFFWRNEGALNLGWQKLVLDSKLANLPEEQKEYQNVADNLLLTSLFGYKLTQDIAASALGQYNTAILDGKFNNPGVFDIGAGATWTPHQIPNLVVTVHPLNYHIVFQDGDTDTQSALGTKLFASYFADLYKGVKWKTDLSGFLEYGSSDPSLNEYTWNNMLNFPVYRGLGLGIGFGLRSSDVDARAIGLTDEGVLQSYYNIGLSYNL